MKASPLYCLQSSAKLKLWLQPGRGAGSGRAVGQLSGGSLPPAAADYCAFSDGQCSCWWICTVKWLREVTDLWRTNPSQNLNPVPNRNQGKLKWLDDSKTKEKLLFSQSQSKWFSFSQPKVCSFSFAYTCSTSKDSFAFPTMLVHLVQDITFSTNLVVLTP